MPKISQKGGRIEGKKSSEHLWQMSEAPGETFTDTRARETSVHTRQCLSPSLYFDLLSLNRKVGF